MSHITAVVPFVPIEAKHLEATFDCLQSLRLYVNRIILICNGKGIDVPLNITRLVDIYMTNPFNLLHAGAVNQGYLEATLHDDTEFILFTNNDIVFPEPVRLQELCIKGSMVSPLIGEQAMSYGAHASCFMIHKDDFKKVGYWNLTHACDADEDWFKRAQGKLEMKNINYKIKHDHPALTANDIGNFESLI